MAAGFVSVPVVPTFKGMSKEFSERLEKPAKASGERAGKAMSQGMESAVENLERQVRASSSKLKDLDRDYEIAYSKQVEMKEKAEAATVKLQAAEEKYQDAVAKGKTGTAEYGKVLDAKAAQTKANRNLEQAEIDVRIAEEKHKEQLDDLNSTLAKLQDSQSDLNRELEKSGGAFGSAKDRIQSMADSAKNGAAKFGEFAQKYKFHASAALGGIGLIAKQSMEYASEAEQSYGAVESIFADHAQGIIDNSKRAATEVGVSGREYRELAANMGAMLKNMGMPMDEVADKSENLVGVAADLAATFGGSTKEAVEAVSSLLRGETDPIERYGVSIKQADINARMAADGLDGLTGEAEKQAKAQTLLKLLTEQTASAQGQFARETDTAAHKQQVATAKYNDAKEAIGTALLPLMAEFADKAANVAKVVGEHPAIFIAVAGAVGTLSAAVIGAATIAPIFTAWSAAAAAAETSMLGLAATTATALAPIVAIVAAVAAAGAALWAFFTKTEVGRDLWDKFVGALQSGWDWISGVFATGWDWLADKIGAFFGWFSDAWNGLWDLFVNRDYTAVLKDVFGWDEDSAAVDYIFRIRDAFSELMGKFREVGDLASGVWDILFHGDYTGLPFGLDEDSGVVDFLFDIREAVQGLWDFLQEKRDQLAALLQPVVQFMAGAMRDVISSLGDIFKSLWDSLKSVGESLGSALGSVAVSLFESLVSVIQSLWKAFQSLWEAVKPIGEFFIKLLLPILKVVGAVIGGVVVGAVFLLVEALKIVAEVLAWVAEKFAWLMENVLGPLIEILGQVAAFIIDTVVSAFTWLAEKVVAVFTTVLEWIGSFLTFLQENFWPAVEAIMGFVGDAFTALWDGLSWAWENIIQPVFNGILELAKITLGVIATIILAPLLIAWNLLSSAIQWAWENIIQPVWQALANFAQEVLWPILQTVFQWIGDAWQWLSDKFSEVWGWIRDNVLNPMVDFFQNTLWPAIQSVIDWIVDKWNWLSETLSTVWGWIYDNVIQNVIDGFHAIWDAVSAVAGWIADKWNWLYGILLNIWNWLNENVIQRQIRGFHRIWEAVLSVAGWIADKWNWMSDRLHAGWAWINDHVFTPFKDGLKRLESFFGTVVDGIRSVWDGLKAVLAKPINFMINTVYNDGIAKAWDTIAGFLPLEPKTAKRLSPIGGYATGGAIRGAGTGTSDDILAWLSNGEHVWTAQDVRDIGGQSAMYAMRDALKHGRGFTFDGKNLALLPHVDSRVGDLAGAAPGLFPQGAFKDGGEVRPMWELQLERGHRWAKSRHGRPYVLGGSADGGGGTDCSGFMSGIADVMGGGSGARQWATMAFNGGGNSQYPSGPQGFVAGLKAHTFSIGVTNGGAAGGHTAGTLGATSRVGAVNVESGGSPSLVKYGTGAVGANDGYFTTHYHLPIGPGGAFEIGKGSGGPSPDMMRAYISKKVEGAIDKIMGPIANRLPSGPPVWKNIPRGVYDKGKESMADKTADVVANLGDRLSTVFTAAQEVGDIVRDGARGVMELAGRAIGLHDSGGWLQDGNLALNMSGKPEPVLTNAQWSSVSEMVKSIGDLVPAIEGQTKAIAKAVDDTQAWLSKAGDYNSIEGINARQGVRRVLDLGIDIPGSDVIKSVLDGEDTLWDSRARAAKNLDTIVEKEKALEEARKAVADLNDMPEGVSEDDQKKIDEAQKALDDAKAEKAKAESDDDRAKAADKVTEAEKKLKDVREEVDKNSEENAKKHAEEVTKANEAVSKAEQELADARKKQAMDLDNVVLLSQGQIKGMIPQAKQLADQLIGMGAPAQAVNAGLGQVTGQLLQLAGFAGPAGITLGMAMDMLKVGIGIIKAIVGAIEDLIAKIRKARLDALKALADGWSIIADYAKLIVDLQGKVTTLQQALIRGANAQREAEYNLLLAQHDRYIAEAEGALKVAEARLALDAEIKRGATIAQLKMMGLHEDWDSYMAYQALEAQGVLEEWSDAAISALFTYEKARAEALKGEVSARLDQIKAEAALAEAQRENVRNQQDLLKAQERLIRMSAKVAGVDLVDATGTAQVAKLMAEMAEVKQAMDKNTLGRWGAKLGARGSYANEYRGQQAQYNSLQQALDAVLAETGVNIDRGNLDRVLKLMGRAAYRGGDPTAVLRAQLPELAQAETALKINESLKPVYDARDQRDDLARKVEDFTAEIDLYEKTTPLEHTLKGLDYTIKSLEQASQAWAEGNEEIRGEYLAAARANRDAAEAAGVDWKLDSKYANAGVRDQIRRETTIHLDGEKMYTADQIDQLLAEVMSGTNGSYRIVRSASEVAVSRRKERV